MVSAILNLCVHGAIQVGDQYEKSTFFLTSMNIKMELVKATY